MGAAIAKLRPVSSTEIFTFSESLSARVETVMVRTGEVSELLSGKEMLVGAVGIELKATLKARKLLIPLNAKNAKNTECAQVRYAAGTRTMQRGKVGRTDLQASMGDSRIGNQKFFRHFDRIEQANPNVP